MILGIRFSPFYLNYAMVNSFLFCFNYFHFLTFKSFSILPRHDFNFSAWVSFVWIQKQCLKVRETFSFLLIFTIFPVFIYNVRPNIRYLSVCINLQHSLVGYKFNDFLFSVSCYWRFYWRSVAHMWWVTFIAKLSKILRWPTIIFIRKESRIWILYLTSPKRFCFRKKKNV